MTIRPDNINFLSTLPAYIGIGEPTGNISISGSIADGASSNFSVTIPTSTNNTRFDVYGINQNNGTKQLLSSTNFPLIYQYVSTEIIEMEIAYASSSVTVTFTIFNFTGALINLTNQVIKINVVEYQIPF